MLHIALQSIGEFCSVATRKYKIQPDAVDRVTRAILKSPHFVKLHYRKATFKRALNVAAGSSLRFWDAMLAATMLEHDVAVIHTEDKGFGKVKGIKAVNPFK